MKMRSIYYSLKNFFLLLYSYIYDYKVYKNSKSSKYHIANIERSILLIVHALEKGLSFAHKKKNWGGEKAYELCRLLDNCYLKYINQDIKSLAVNILSCYKEDDFSCKEKCLVDNIESIINRNRNLIDEKYIGVKQINEPPFFNEQQIVSFFDNRISVRYFSDLKLTDEEIKKAINFAKCTPTACNRQSSKVYVFRQKDKMKEILDNQMGDQGWCKNASALIVITGNESYFNGTYERRQVFIDGGLYAMNFVYGLHLQHIASCYKMFISEPRREKKFKKLCNIPNNEVPIVLILSGHYNQYPTYSPLSKKIETKYEVDGIKM